MRTLLQLSLATLAVAVLPLGCGADEGGSRTLNPGADSPKGGAANGGDGSGGGSILPCLAGACGGGTGTPANCGDGVRTDDEACDDGNRAGDDGCAADCLSVGAGYSCAKPGTACRRIARCGDGILALPEQCDDGATKAGDGCSASCHVELGFKCSGTPSLCVATVCGDGKLEGTETCDDSNTLPFDGCSERCQAEPGCGAEGCTSTCGDGLVIGEACDDGNKTDGDGCSAKCTVETGFKCAAEAACTADDPGCVLRVAAIFRDFNASRDDFSLSCGREKATTGMVAATLTDGHPTLVDGSLACVTAPQFADWYGAKHPAMIVGHLDLFPDGKGGFVNRWGSKGERWTVAGTGGADVAYDGNPLFFPIDDAPNALSDTRYAATVPTQYGGGWRPETDFVPTARKHNFHFTTEVSYWFTYDPKTPATLSFTGDDDVWVFVNGQLAVDLGGLHEPLDGSVTIDATNAFGMTAGKVYPINIFHAERNETGSSFRLTLSGFDASRSTCTPVCGDGKVSLGEECDDGVNDGGYGECFAGCVLGAYCGDGKQDAGEDCDDGNRVDGDGCGSGCRNVILR